MYWNASQPVSDFAEERRDEKEVSVGILIVTIKAIWVLLQAQYDLI